MKTFIVILAVVVATNGYGLDEEIFAEENIQPFARTRHVRQGYGSLGDDGPVAPVAPKPQPYVPSYGSGGGSPGGGYGTGGPVSFGGNNNQGFNRPSTGGGYGGGGNQGFNRPSTGGGYGGGSNQGFNRPSNGGGSGWGSPQRPSGGYQIQPQPFPAPSPGYGSLMKPIGSGGYGGIPQQPIPQKPLGGYGGAPQIIPQKPMKYEAPPQTGGPGYGPPPPVDDYKEDSYSAPPSIQPGYGVPEKAPTGPVGYGR